MCDNVIINAKNHRMGYNNTLKLIFLFSKEMFIFVIKS
ncbi:hypothetical protein ADIARSV_2032 [Arcticibacter svalbardensis MN12-7]|uniref:Uncharacterized protein n=1 Tax=Arcticibacter svalbardensis MN12-7 TaxID=1150600 RepID=R9GSX7_9SPHI|nr:hypothetical protein ADIARSV_2032 [Arcticibacter svalbardensis MN12-7]